MRKFIKFLVRNIPRPVLIRFSYIFSRLIIPFYRGNTVQCPICENSFRKFLPYGNAGAVNRLCPRCLSLERHRLLWLYLRDHSDFFTAPLRVLHIAPEQPFIKRFRALENLDYKTADLFSPIADIKLDIREMPLQDNTFDVLICNHVLEHIDNEPKAIREVYRVLKPGGWAILQVPMDYSLENTYEDPSITSSKEREKHFGQYDHLRKHGADYPERLKKEGFLVEGNDLVKRFPPDLTERYRLSSEEIIYICRKQSV